MSKLGSILQGWKSYFTNETPDFAKDRAEICSECNHAKEGSFEVILKETEIKEVEGLKCSLCNCPLVTKLRSEIERCPVDKW